LCYSKWKAGDGVSAVEDSSATICLGTRTKEIHLLVHSLVFSIAKSSSEAVCKAIKIRISYSTIIVLIIFYNIITNEIRNHPIILTRTTI